MELDGMLSCHVGTGEAWLDVWAYSRRIIMHSFVFLWVCLGLVGYGSKFALGGAWENECTERRGSVRRWDFRGCVVVCVKLRAR